MRLSEAIREGCKYGPQAFGLFHDERFRGSTCALGAAELACDASGRVKLHVIALWAEKREVPCPHKGCDYIPHPVTGDRFERKLGLWDESKPESPVVTEAVKASLEPVKRNVFAKDRRSE
jgi:hypothetical protein